MRRAGGAVAQHRRRVLAQPRHGHARGAARGWRGGGHRSLGGASLRLPCWRTMNQLVRVASRALAVLLVGCGNGATAPLPAGQILLFIDTDAPLPPAPGSSGDLRAP